MSTVIPPSPMVLFEVVEPWPYFLACVMMTQTLQNLVVDFLESWKNCSPSILTAADLCGQPMRPKYVMKWDTLNIATRSKPIKIAIILVCCKLIWIPSSSLPSLLQDFQISISFFNMLINFKTSEDDNQSSKLNFLSFLHTSLALFGLLYGLFGPFLTLFNTKTSFLVLLGEKKSAK